MKIREEDTWKWTPSKMNNILMWNPRPSTKGTQAFGVNEYVIHLKRGVANRI